MPQLAQQYRFKTINVIRRRGQETLIRNLGGSEVICTADEDLTARLQESTVSKGVERVIDSGAGNLLTMFSTGALTPEFVRYPLKDFQEAVRLADGEAGQVKVLLDFSE